METIIHYLPLGIFFTALGLIAFEILDKSLIALSGAVLMILFGYINPEQALHAIDFETIILLMSMMMLVEISRKSGIFSWMNVKLVSLTRGNPLAIAIIFSIITALFSAFLDNVTTIIIVVPITIELFRGLGRDPKPIILQEILMSNIGGALTLIGDPTHIIIGNAAHLTFNDFITNLIIPVGGSILTLIGVFIIVRWKHLKPITKNLKTLLLSMMLIRKLEYEFLDIELSKSFIIKSLTIIFLTLIGFALQTKIGLPVHIIGLTGALTLAIITSKNIHIHDALKGVEWTTLMFFAGLFVMVAGVEHTGILEQISKLIVSNSDNFGIVIIYVLWGCNNGHTSTTSRRTTHTITMVGTCTRSSHGRKRNNNRIFSKCSRMRPSKKTWRTNQLLPILKIRFSNSNYLTTHLHSISSLSC